VNYKYLAKMILKKLGLIGGGSVKLVILTKLTRLRL
jgi:hypothetical protein